MQSFEKASHIIPIFRGGNFQFKVKEFIDAVVEHAKKYDGELKLIETHYKTKKIPAKLPR